MWLTRLTRTSKEAGWRLVGGVLYHWVNPKHENRYVNGSVVHSNLSTQLHYHSTECRGEK
jgi:hypothetical protein